ncbi:MAG TPA: carboxypeptidase regulatory-like domain-containing protein [Prolixibacteraceae bacterium]|nr:carboxypeptidase regulatory-like domain-containing protein [Prolixibacteraceae bacterium]
MRTIILLIAVFLANIFSEVIAQQTVIDKLTTQLDKRNENILANKVFIKTDKDIYAPGEKIWFKAEMANIYSQRTTREANLVVMIRTASGDVVADGQFFIVNGLCSNFITVPSWVPEGNAFVIAYDPKAPTTNDASLAAIKPVLINQLKRNDYRLEAKFDKTLYKPGEELKLHLQLTPISNTSKKERVNIKLFDYHKIISESKENLEIDQTNLLKFKLPDEIENGLYLVIESAGKNGFCQKIPVRTTKDQINVSFYVEGNNLLLNNNQRIIYRATDPFGAPVEVSGEVYDENGSPAGMGKALKTGIGILSLVPLPDHDYIFKINSEYGKGQQFELPKPVSNGTAFTIIRTEENAIRVAILNTGDNIGKNLNLVALAKGKVKLAIDFKAEQRNSFMITTNELPLGTVNFIVVDQNAQVLSERLYYNYPNKDLDFDIPISVNPDNASKEININIDLNSIINQFGNGTYDIKITDANNLFEKNESLSYNLLEFPLSTPAPKNMLEHYITNTEMIANKYRHYSVQDVINNIDYAPKQNSNCLSGYVTDKDGQRIPNAMVMVVHPNNPALATTRSDSNGQFYFYDLAKNNDIIVKAVSENGKKNYSVHLHRSLYESLEEMLLFTSFKNFKPYSNKNIREYFNTNEHLLKLAGSETKDRKPAEVSNTVKMLQSGTSIIDVVRMIKPFTISGDKIIFSGGHNSFLAQDGALIVVDGQKMGTSMTVLTQINPYDVVSINVSTNPVDIQQYTAFNTVGIIEISTRGSSFKSRLGADNDTPEEPEIENLDINSMPEEIFKYQSTIFWETNVQPNAEGKIERNVILNDLQTDFVIQVDALSPDGIPYSQKFFFTTKN